MSPEFLTNQQYTEKCDIWSLGVIIYQLAAMEMPFQAENEMKLAKKI